jgi:hypothetical protein
MRSVVRIFVASALSVFGKTDGEEYPIRAGKKNGFNGDSERVEDEHQTVDHTNKLMGNDHDTMFV